MLFDLNKSGVKTPKLEPLRTSEGELMYKGRVPGVLASVSVTEYNYKEGEFAGRAVKTLRFTFDNIPGVNEALRQTIVDIKIVGRVTTTNGVIGNRDRADVVKNLTDDYERVRHFYDVFNAQPNYKALTAYPIEEVKDALNINFEGTVDEYVASFEKYVAFFANKFNVGKNEKPIFVDAKGKPVSIWIRLVREYQYGKSFELPKWVGAGILEVIRFNESMQPYDSTLPFEPASELVVKEKGQKGAAGAPVSTPAAPGFGAPQHNAGAPAATPGVSPALAAILNKVQNQPPQQ